ncbi:MAG: class I SAM-dependent methyltransferase [Mesorhizobium sp.]|nr:MAG: class I SAM-dependent methyltransferase [Mesorhizobium sp.]
MVRVIGSLEELDEKIAECEATLSMSDRQRLFSSFAMQWSPQSKDPFSSEYRDEQLSLYRRITGKKYDVAHEVSNFDLDAATARPFPYASLDPETVGTQTIAVGTILRKLADVPRGGRILEFGPGWGNTTLAMALTGYRVTAVDIEEKFCELIRRRATQNEVDIEVINGDFMWAETVTEPYDAVVFFECFHHCDDHMRLLRALDKVIKPGGRIIFAGEPIGPAFPMPWGLRLDGEALWAIRSRGWLELGFNDRYFRNALESLGWTVTLHESGETFIANVWECRRLAEYTIEIPANDPQIGAPQASQTERGIVVEDLVKGWAFCGPFCHLPKGRWRGIVKLDTTAEQWGFGVLEVCHGKSATVLNSVDARLPSETFEIAFDLAEPVDQLQIRFFASKRSTFIVSSFVIMPDNTPPHEAEDHSQQSNERRPSWFRRLVR